MVAGILALLQTQRSGGQFDGKTILATFPVWATAAAFIGSVYPLADHWMYGKIHEFKQDWSNTIRSIAILVGIHQASTVSWIQFMLQVIFTWLRYQKIPFSNVYELVGTLIFIAVGLWWMSDRSRCGFFLALLLSTLGVVISIAANSIGYSRWVFEILVNYHGNLCCLGMEKDLFTSVNGVSVIQPV